MDKRRFSVYNSSTFFLHWSTFVGQFRGTVVMANVMLVVENNLCTGCCECIGACNANNICIMLGKAHDHPTPYISVESDCTGCSECLNACPQSELLVQTIA